MAIHKPYGGSTAKRTLACPSWHARSAQLPPTPPGPAARLGTALHAVLEACLNDLELDPYTFENQEIEGELLSVDLISEKVFPSLDDIEHLTASWSLKYLHAEMFCELAEHSDVGGTADFVGLDETGEVLCIADYKTGDGEMVWATDNDQLLFYAMCVIDIMDLPNLKKIVLAITQPSERRERSLDVWVTTPARVKRFRTRYLKAVKQSKSRNPSSATGDHCRYCPAQALCPDYNALSTHTLPSLEQLSKMQVKELSEAMSLADKLEPWIKAVRKLAQETLERGQLVQGYKLVQKRASRVWNEPSAAEKRLNNLPAIKTEDCYKRELKSPAQIEKLCKAHGLNFEQTIGDLVSSVSSGTTLAHDSDPRPSVTISNIKQRVLERFV